MYEHPVCHVLLGSDTVRDASRRL